MRKLLLTSILGLTSFAAAQSAAPAPPTTWDRLHLLIGTWQARTGSVGSAKAGVSGAYTFREDLDGHAIVRTSTADTCASPQPFDCKHNDLLTLYPEGPDKVAALYLDSEGHVIHYAVAAPDADTVIFQSNNSGPNFRLFYHRTGNSMEGKFQIAPPGSGEFKSYLEWSGTKK